MKPHSFNGRCRSHIRRTRSVRSTVTRVRRPVRERRKSYPSFSFCKAAGAMSPLTAGCLSSPCRRARERARFDTLGDPVYKKENSGVSMLFFFFFFRGQGAG